MAPQPRIDRRPAVLVLGVVLLIVAFAIPNLLALRLRAAQAGAAGAAPASHAAPASPGDHTEAG